MEGTKVYKCWQQLKNRCLNSNDHRFADYGGRGLKVSKRWMKFENFLKDMGEPPAKNFSIDRVDNLKGYFPGNCRWATPKQQMRNRRGNANYTYMGKTKCLSEWAEYLGLSYSLLKQRHRLGWDFKRMITEPIHLEFRR
jgi:hypothetical protein